VARGDYAANTGDTINVQPLDLRDGATPPFTGVIFYHSLITARDITDGMNNTYLAGEKLLSTDGYFNGWCPGDDNHVYCGDNWDTQRGTNINFPFMADRPGGYYYESFGSPHIPGCHMLFCDGAVQLVNYTIEPTVHALLGNRADGKPIDSKRY
jgi:hypothetical protein